ncbi:MAG: orotate phosphoribosyltransferase [Caldisericia bacterium]|nr:orotate phosphoribosyltransferase [Caldisericia bacterium]
MPNNDPMEILKSTSAITTGHFKLSSGLHSGTYIQCAKVFQFPEKSRELCELLKEKLGKINVQTIIGPAAGGIIFAYEMSRVFGVRNIFAERKDGKMTFRRGFSLEKGERVLLCEDVVTTGGSVSEVGEVAESLGANVIGICSLVDRSGGKASFPWKFIPLISMEVKTYNPDECPLCKDGVPVNSPGSRFTK